MNYVIRRSKRPAKQLVWFFFQKHLKSSLNFNYGLDIACGDMFFYKYFKTNFYTGVDIDEKRLLNAKKVFPNAKIVESAIETLPKHVKGDFVVCIQAIGINTIFNIDNTLLAVEKLIGATNSGGMLIFNIGQPCMKYRTQILEILKQNFQYIKIFYYGNFNNELNLYSAYILALLMWFFPFLRGKSSIYFMCKKRK